ncbi:M12 family metallopeptidase [Deinococcus sp.]|uniref:M12 family metallopeptidase n=1 Tax=Deinococcus sp. TaxID=47478 RepID=UPI003CC6BE58
MLTACSDSGTATSPVAPASFVEAIAPGAPVVKEGDLAALSLEADPKILRSHTFSDGKVFDYVEYQGNVIDGDAILGTVQGLEAQFVAYEDELKSAKAQGIKTQGAMTNRCVGGIYFGACVSNWQGVRWPKPYGQSWTPVYYEPLSNLSSQGQQAVLSAMTDIQNATFQHILFFQSSSASNRIYFTQNSDAPGVTGGCFSPIGLQDGRQQLNLDIAGCQDKGRAIHEILHALGMMHEQSRPDRDNYITINNSNLTPLGVQNIGFKYWDRDMTEHTPFDFGSIMMYPQTLNDPQQKFIYNSSQPLYFLNVSLPGTVNPGQRDGLSASDIATLNMRYQ